jgi:integrase
VALRRKPLPAHLEGFRQSLLAKERTEKYISETVMMLKCIFEGCGLKYWTDISATKIEVYLKKLRDNGLSFRRSNGYLKAAKQVCKWMVESSYAIESPLRHLKALNEQVDRRHDRRALEPDEIRRLLETTATGQRRFGMEGHERYLLYRFAAETGLRANETRTLTAGSFDFREVTVTVKAGRSKRRHEDVLPLRADTAELLRDFLQDRLPTVRAFGGSYKRLTDKTADMLKADLADAGISYVDDTGRYADFHSLRHTTGTLLAASGVHPKIAQSVMRHSKIDCRYTPTR